MLKTRIPPPLYLLIFAGLMWLLHLYLPLAHWIPQGWRNIGWGVIAVGVLIDTTSLGLFLRTRTTPNPLQPENASRLVASGPYRFTRNPMYLGLFISLTGWAIFLGCVSPMLLLPGFIAVVTHFQIKPEEEALERIFGEEYLAYKQRVPRWLKLP